MYIKLTLVFLSVILISITVNTSLLNFRSEQFLRSFRSYMSTEKDSNDFQMPTVRREVHGPVPPDVFCFPVSTVPEEKYHHIPVSNMRCVV